MIYVVAPSYERFIKWCRDHGRQPNASWVKFVREQEDIQGCLIESTDRFVYLGGDHNLISELRFRRGEAPVGHPSFGYVDKPVLPAPRSTTVLRTALSARARHGRTGRRV